MTARTSPSVHRHRPSPGGYLLSSMGALVGSLVVDGSARSLDLGGRLR